MEGFFSQNVLHGSCAAEFADDRPLHFSGGFCSPTKQVIWFCSATILFSRQFNRFSIPALLSLDLIVRADEIEEISALWFTSRCAYSGILCRWLSDGQRNLARQVKPWSCRFATPKHGR